MQDIKKDYFWNTCGVLLQNAISPLLLVVVTRVNGIYDSGIFSFAFSMAIIFWVFGMWGGRTYQVSDVKQEFSHRSYIMVRLILTLVMMLGAGIFVVVNNYDAGKSSVIIALVLFKACESIADAVHGVLQINDKLYIVGKSLFYKAIGGFAAFTIIDIWTGDILLGCLGIVGINILVILFYDLRFAKKLAEVKIEPRHFRQTVKSALTIMRRTWPISTVVFLSLLALNIPRYFIDLYHQEQIGYFGILAMPITLISLVVAFILQPKVVHLSKLYGNGNFKAFGSTTTRLLGVTALMGGVILAVAYVFGVPLLQFVFGIDFSMYHFALVLLLAGGIVSALVFILINIFTIIRRFKYQFYILVSTNIVLAVCSAVFVKEYGLQGGVVLFVLTNCVQLLLMAIAYKIVLMQSKRASPSP